MTSRRRSSRTASRVHIQDENINDLVLKLQAVLPDSSSRCTSTVPASKILEETCNYIKMLHKEVDNLSEKLSQTLASMDSNNIAEPDNLNYKSFPTVADT